ncbi:glutathione-regulated potassium-efflux system protein KefC [Leptothrix discophora]|uniref:Glutathione-regulated potassium-efflux system protein KefC n=1 Tax=Leptothrix discophora TaxID=89 RepID=A0ABT9G2Z0_LEPDI|nr:glutathione-regulated potassium-efflux system protein KefC [Leptothrix discophora]MDP4300632.1 glutathione-regulated potassium-efflux system protein KefC [Leptothrix discophora]
MNGHGNWLLTSLVFFAAAVVGVPLARALGLGAIIGYLIAGIAIGPSGLGLIGDPQTVLHVAEFGVVLMLFLVGLELEPRRLWSLRRPIFGWGGAQVIGCAAALTGVALLLGVPWRWALVGALGLALSSTAVALQVLQERNLLAAPAGQSAFAILLFQDVAAIPILALLPLLGSGQAAAGNPWLEAGKALGVVAAIVLGGRLLLRHGLRWVASSRTPEIFTAASLGLVVGIAALMQAVDLSMALGAFLGGVLLAESEYKRALETDVEPFKGLLLGLFFMAVGMSIDFAVLRAHPWVVAGLLLGFLLVKTVALVVLARAMGIARGERPVWVLLLAQGGEFAFVVFQQAAGAGVFDAATASLLVGAVALSMLVSPLVLVALDRWLPAPKASAINGHAHQLDDEPAEAPVIVCGYGRYGQIVGRLLYASGLKATLLDHDPEQVEVMRRFGFRTYYGDATRLDLLRKAGAAEARAIVVAVDDVEQSLKIVELVQTHFKQAQLVVRARNVQHHFRLRELGVERIERETFESALASGRSVLELMGHQPHHAWQLATRFRRFNKAMVERSWPHRADRDELVALAKQGSAQLEELFAQERAARERPRRGTWEE